MGNTYGTTSSAPGTVDTAISSGGNVRVSGVGMTASGVAGNVVLNGRSGGSSGGGGLTNNQQGDEENAALLPLPSSHETKNKIKDYRLSGDAGGGGVEEGRVSGVRNKEEQQQLLLEQDSRGEEEFEEGEGHEAQCGGNCGPLSAVTPPLGFCLFGYFVNKLITEVRLRVHARVCVLAVASFFVFLNSISSHG